MTVTALPTQPDRGRAASLRVRPVPRIDGPYDDERTDPAPPMVDGSLALAFPPPTRVSVPLRLVPPAGGVSPAMAPTRRDLLPDPRPWTARLAQAIAEVLAGARPAGQLSRVATLDVLALLERGRRSARRPAGITAATPDRRFSARQRAVATASPKRARSWTPAFESARWHSGSKASMASGAAPPLHVG